MCMAYEMKCSCGDRSASFHFRDNILPEQVIRGMHCPSCSAGVVPDAETMVADNGWIIRYDMDVANAVGRSRIAAELTPALLFDEGYCTWNGMYPGDHVDSVREREKITALAKTNPVEYLRKLKTWAVERADRLRREGWRKAQNPA